MLSFLYFFSKAAVQKNFSKNRAQGIWSLKYLSLNGTAYHHLLELSNLSTRHTLFALTALLLLLSLSIYKQTSFSALQYLPELSEPEPVTPWYSLHC